MPVQVDPDLPLAATPRHVAFLTAAVCGLRWRGQAVGSSPPLVIVRVEDRVEVRGVAPPGSVGGVGSVGGGVGAASRSDMAAASGIRTIGLFGGTAPFGHASLIVPVLPPDGKIDKAGGMARIDVAHVLRSIETARGSLAP